MAQGRTIVDYADDKAIVTIQSGNFADQASFGPTDYDNIAFYARDKFIDLNAKRVAAISTVTGEDPEAAAATEAPTAPADTSAPVTEATETPAADQPATTADDSILGSSTETPTNAPSDQVETPTPAPTPEPQNLSKAVVDVVYLSDKSYGGLKLEYEGGELFLESKGSFDADLENAKETSLEMNRQLLFGDSVIQYEKQLATEASDTNAAPIVSDTTAAGAEPVGAAGATADPAAAPGPPQTPSQAPADASVQTTGDGSAADNNGASAS